MSAKKDLVEAHAFNRRRLVTAFLSGAPGGREVEPVRYGRALVGGAVLAVLLVVGALVAGFLKPPIPEGWDDNTLVVVEETGARFLAQHVEATGGTELTPVTNTTSARLLYADETGALELVNVPESQIADAVTQPTVGIPGAPDAVPDPEELVQSGWSVCANDQGGLRAVIAQEPLVAPVPDQALVASDRRGESFLVTDNQRFPLRNGGDSALVELGLSDGAFEVPGRWLNLLDLGPTIEAFSVPGQGESVETGITGLAEVGATLSVDDDRFLLVSGSDGPALLPVGEVAYAAYRSGSPGADSPEFEPEAGDLAGLSTVDRLPGLGYLDDLPDEQLTPYAEGGACLVLGSEGDSSARESLLAAPAGVEASTGAVPSGAGVERQVEPGHGAVVRDATPGASLNGASVLIDSTGTRFALGEGGQDYRDRLGYAQVDPPRVNPGWTALFADGPVLVPEDVRAGNSP